MNERRLNGRDVLAKTFPARTKKGYDPLDVDAYLELVAAQVDLLHADIGAAQASDASDGSAVAAVPIIADGPDLAELEAELAASNADREALQARLDEVLAAAESLGAENQQLRTQLASVAPPPPVSGTAVVIEEPVDAVVEAEEVSAELVAAQSQSVVVDDRASEESYGLVLRAAQRSAEEAISEAHIRADEIIADANLTASRIAQESDRKAYEAATRAQGELAVINADIASQADVLAEVSSQTDTRRNELRRLGETMIALAEQGSDDVVDLRAAPIAYDVTVETNPSETQA